MKHLSKTDEFYIEKILEGQEGGAYDENLIKSVVDTVGIKLEKEVRAFIEAFKVRRPDTMKMYERKDNVTVMTQKASSFAEENKETLASFADDKNKDRIHFIKKKK